MSFFTNGFQDWGTEWVCSMTYLQDILKGKLCSALFHKLNFNRGHPLTLPEMPVFNTGEHIFIIHSLNGEH